MHAGLGVIGELGEQDSCSNTKLFTHILSKLTCISYSDLYTITLTNHSLAYSLLAELIRNSICR